MRVKFDEDVIIESLGGSIVFKVSLLGGELRLIALGGESRWDGAR